jgi:hypothetical protein
MKDDPGLLRALKQVSETDVGRKRFCGVLIELLDCPRADLAGLLRAAIYNVMPYGDYLKTSHWKRIAREAKERAGNRCQLCNAESDLESHHRTYERRGYEQEGDITVLCGPCHGKFHGKEPQ